MCRVSATQTTKDRPGWGNGEIRRWWPGNVSSGKSAEARRSFMGAYIGANETFGSGDPDPHQRRFEQVISYRAALESAYREIAELKDKLAQEKLYLEDEIRGEMDFEGI